MTGKFDGEQPAGTSEIALEDRVVRMVRPGRVTNSPDLGALLQPCGDLEAAFGAALHAQSHGAHAPKRQEAVIRRGVDAESAFGFLQPGRRLALRATTAQPIRRSECPPTYGLVSKAWAA